jgi:hypothetical protein
LSHSGAPASVTERRRRPAGPRLAATRRRSASITMGSGCRLDSTSQRGGGAHGTAPGQASVNAIGPRGSRSRNAFSLSMGRSRQSGATRALRDRGSPPPIPSTRIGVARWSTPRIEMAPPVPSSIKAKALCPRHSIR